MDELHTRREAAAKLRCSTKTLDKHVAGGALRYVLIGHGVRHLRKMFPESELVAFLTNQTRKEIPLPCPFTRTRDRHTIGTTSSSEIVAFSAQPRPRAKGPRKR
jgi:hypothetical protein